MFFDFLFDFESPTEKLHILLKCLENLNILEITLTIFYAGIFLLTLLCLEWYGGVYRITLGVLLTGILTLILWIFEKYIMTLLIISLMLLIILPVIFLIYAAISVAIEWLREK